LLHYEVKRFIFANQTRLVCKGIFIKLTKIRTGFVALIKAQIVKHRKG